MTHDFDAPYWERHWQDAARGEHEAGGTIEPNPYLVRETSDLPPGTALEAGCGEGTEAIWLASRGWDVLAADISADALTRAAAPAAEADLPGTLTWLQADLTAWTPGTQFDLVTTHYAHPTMPQLAFYHRLSGWVAPGGTLLIVGHLHTDEDGHEPPAEASVTVTDVVKCLDATTWKVVTAEERDRSMNAPGGRVVPLRDVIVRATRRA